MNFFIPIFTIVLSVTTYQLATKLAPGQINPWQLLSLVYFIATLITFGVGSLDRQHNIIDAFRQTTWPVWLMGVAIVGIELGYLLAFRAGWKISLAGLTASVSVAILMLPIGLIFFREKLSALNFAGMALCIVGLILVTRR